MPKVSIIMPSLNVRDYIEKCLDSVLGQTLQDIEVICVDADSTDGTHEILERYAKKDSRVRLLRDDQHSTGYAKNLGIDMARGEYVGIVEPDDYTELNARMEMLPGSLTIESVPSGAAQTASTISSTLCFRISRPHFGQWGTPVRAHRSRR